MANELNAKLKRWPGWVLLVLVIAGFLAVGADALDRAREPGGSRRRDRSSSGVPDLRW